MVAKKNEPQKETFPIGRLGIKTIAVGKQVGVAFLSPNGCAFKKVANRSLKQLKVPHYAYAFWFFDSLEITVVFSNGQRQHFFSKPSNISPFYYYGAVLLNRDDIIKHPKMNKKSKKNVLEMMDRLHLKQVVRDRFGNIDPYHKAGRIVILPASK